MSTIITPEQLSKIIPTNKSYADWVDPINTELPKYNITTPQRIAAFLSQCAHESSDFTHLHENLNYGAQGLLMTFPKHFNSANVSAYARQPMKIANCVYANRMGNGDENSGDGFKYRGRGILQITGKANYHVCSESLFNDERLVETPDIVETDFDVALLSALWYWNTHLLNNYADAGDILNMTKKINGGTIGLDDRTARYSAALSMLQQ